MDESRIPARIRSHFSGSCCSKRVDVKLLLSVVIFAQSVKSTQAVILV
jgi:hypothetical protein